MMPQDLRPTKLEEIVGNDKLKRVLKIIVAAAKKEDRSIPHTVLHGHYGCGKTTIARVLAHEIGSAFIEVNAAAIKSKEDLLKLIPKIEKNTVLFIDEIHRLKTKHEELFYSLMEDFRTFIPTPDGIVEINIPQFTLIGATTNLGSLSGPFLSRFIQNHSVSMYSNEELKEIVRLSASKLKIGIDEDAALLIAERSKNVPRYANNRLTWVKDYCSSEDKVYIGIKEVDEAFELVGIDENGFDEMDRSYLDTIERFQPIGLTNLAAAIGATPETVIKYIEPIMLARDIVTITREGRSLKGFSSTFESCSAIDELL